MSDLAKWLLEQIADDEAWAGRAAPRYDGDPWDPLRVLAECQTKRWIVAECQDVIVHCAKDGEAAMTVDLADFVLRRLALPYADRPGFREEWRTTYS